MNKINDILNSKYHNNSPLYQDEDFPNFVDDIQVKMENIEIVNKI